MSQLESMMSFYRSALSDKIKVMASPLESAFGIDVFWYHVNASDGYYTFAGNCPDVTEFYYGNDSHHENPYLRHPENYTTGALLPLCTPTPEYLRSQLPTSQKFGMGQILLLMLKEGSVCHHFGFTSTQKNVEMDKVFLNHLPLLVKFRDYFLGEWKSYRSRMETHTINMGEVIGPKYFQLSEFRSDPIPESKKRTFLDEINGVQKFVTLDEGKHVSQRAISLIEENLFSEQDMKVLAKSVGASSSALMRHFKNETNETIFSYIRRRRLDEAMKLLRRGTFSVAEVASLVGYNNFGAFTDAFKVQFKKPPSHFSKNVSYQRKS